jgi:flagellar biosynthesis component FlhA
VRDLVADAGAVLPLDLGARQRLAAIVRALARDRVPLSSIDVMVEVATDAAGPVEAVARVRRELWQQLPGNEPGRRRIALSADVLRRLDDVFKRAATQIALTVSPLEVDALERVIAEWVAANGPPERLAVLVPDERARRLVQRLVRRHHPDVPVLVENTTREAMEAGTGDREELHA